MRIFYVLDNPSASAPAPQRSDGTSGRPKFALRRMVKAESC